MKKFLLLFLFSSILSAQNLEYFIAKNHPKEERKDSLLKRLINFNDLHYTYKDKERFFKKGTLGSYLEEDEVEDHSIAEPKKHFEETGNFKPFTKKDFFIMFKFINIGYDKWDFNGFNLGYCVSDESCFGK